MGQWLKGSVREEAYSAARRWQAAKGAEAQAVAFQLNHG